MHAPGCEGASAEIRKLPRRRAALALVVAWTLASSGAAAQSPPTESAVKAAYLFRFLAYVEWPSAALPPAGEPIVIGVLGADAVAAALPSIVAGRQLDGRPVVARSLASPAASLDGVHVLFIGRSMPAERVIARLGNRPVLVVTDGEGEAGGMLNFVVVDGRVRFEAVPAAAEQAGLKLGARLLAVAERVHRP